MQIQQKIPTHIVSGFLGAGKTTLLQDLFQLKPEHERWAVLMNEFGQIGIDQHLLETKADIQVKEVLGGCLCCTSQLPMHHALNALITECKPNRIWIEPSGLGHPLQLLEQLNEPHWQSHLALQGVCLVINGQLLHNQVWLERNFDEKLFKTVSLVIISHSDQMTDEDRLSLNNLQQQYQQFKQKWLCRPEQAVQLSDFQTPYYSPNIKPVSLLSLRQDYAQQDEPAVYSLPHHYVQQRDGFAIAGWKFAKSWQFRADELIDLFAQVAYLRLKAILHTEQGWLYFNCNSHHLSYKIGNAHYDSRLEIIYENDERDWLAFEQGLLRARIVEN